MVQQEEGIHPNTPIQEALLDGQEERRCRDLYPWQGLLQKSQKEAVWTVEMDSEIGGGPLLSAT